MDEHEFPVVLDLTDQQVAQYVQQVNQLIARRRQMHTLLSVYDLIAGACVTLFMAGQQNQIPAAWVFAMLRPGDMPQGVLDDASTLRQMLDGMEEVARELDGLLDEVQKQVQTIRSAASEVKLARQKVRVIMDKVWDLETRAKDGAAVQP